jgi:hypothetical protein
MDFEVQAVYSPAPTSVVYTATGQRWGKTGEIAGEKVPASDGRERDAVKD